MKNTFFYLLSFILLFGCGANRSLLTVDNVPIEASLDLINGIDDKINVSIDPGAFQTEVVTFKIPKTVPGTYSTDDYGQ